MQSSSVTLICGSHVISSTTAYVIRGMVNSMDITLLDDAGTALDITDVSTWDLGITEDFFGETGVLAGSSTITAAENVLAVTMNGHTEELASLMDGKKSIQAYATLRGRDASDVINRLYVFPVVILNIGFTNDTILTTAAQELTYTKAQIDAKFAAVGDAIPAATTVARGTIQLATGDEVTAGTDTAKAVVPSTLKTELDKKENTANKATDFTVIDDNKFPTIKAVSDFVTGITGDIEAVLDELIGGTP